MPTEVGTYQVRAYLLSENQGANLIGYSNFEAANTANKVATGTLTISEKVTSVASNRTSLSILKVLGKKVSNQTGYRVRVKAYRMIEGKKQYLGETMDLFTVGSKHKTYTNISKMTPKTKTITLTAGERYKTITTVRKANPKRNFFQQNMLH